MIIKLSVLLIFTNRDIRPLMSPLHMKQVISEYCNASNQLVLDVTTVQIQFRNSFLYYRSLSVGQDMRLKNCSVTVLLLVLSWPFGDYLHPCGTPQLTISQPEVYLPVCSNRHLSSIFFSYQRQALSLKFSRFAGLSCCQKGIRDEIDSAFGKK